MTQTILIVDDSLTIRMDLAQAMEDAGWGTVLCDSLGSARSALAAHAVDLIVLDVLLPDGDGIDLLREIRTGEKQRCRSCCCRAKPTSAIASAG